jgi:2-polyprenyl-6-hydroxyphenyl methylase / 3-demethylubiquinone-9 3-methyltransferase
METQDRVNNHFYDFLDELWHEGSQHPIALLRAENNLRNPWVQTIIEKRLGNGCSVLDMGCGGGLLTNELAQAGHKVCGVDLSPGSLSFAQKKDRTGTVNYVLSPVETLPFPDASFDVVCAMDVLEHVACPAKVVEEASRVLKKDGLFFFHTFNRTWLSWLIVIKGVEWCVRNTPSNMHLHRFFVTPKELSQMCALRQLRVEKILGVAPDIKTKAFWKMILSGEVSPDFRFTFTSSLKTGYSGYSVKLT